MRLSVLRSSAVLVSLIVAGSHLHAQQEKEAPLSSSSSSSSSLPNAPSERPLLSAAVNAKKAPPSPNGAFAYLFRGNLSCGSGATVQDAVPQNGVAMCGIGFTFLPGVQVELGGIGPQGGWPRFYISADGYLPLARVSNRLHAEPVAIFGYTKMFYNSNDLDFGLGWDHHIDSTTSVAYELRDYVQFSQAVQHTVVLRVNYVFGGDD